MLGQREMALKTGKGTVFLTVTKRNHGSDKGKTVRRGGKMEGGR